MSKKINENFKNALIKFNSKDFNDAEIFLRRIIQIDNNYHKAYFLLGVIDFQNKSFLTAIYYFNLAISKDPTNPQYNYNLGLTYYHLADYKNAIKFYTLSLNFDNKYIIAYSNKGAAERKAGLIEDALSSYLSAYALDNESIDTIFNIALILYDLKLYEKSLLYFDLAIKLNSNCLTHNSDSYFSLLFFNKANTLRSIGRIGDSIIYYKYAIAINPNYYEALWNLSNALLYIGNFKEGWLYYQHRWHKYKYSPPFENNNILSVSNLTQLNSKNLLIWTEQGIGDVILFSKFLSSLENLCSNIYCIIDKRLISLFNRSYTNIKFIDNVDKSFKIDFQIPFGDIGKFFLLNTDNFKQLPNPHLFACVDKTKFFKKLLHNSTKINCGLIWKSPKSNFNSFKSINLIDLKSILNIDSFNFISLQHGDIIHDFNSLSKDIFKTINEVSSIDLYNDIDHLAALIQSLDLVITISNSTAHLAGSLGKETLLLLSMDQGGFWYWNNIDCDSRNLWYPSVKVFKQTTPNDWSDPIDKLRSYLLDFIKF
jgi:tetratricopeptide (TPR) repeat protein